MEKLNGKEAVRVPARWLNNFRRKGKRSSLYLINNKEVWLPSQHVQDQNDEILIEKWLYNKKVENGEL